MKRVAIFGTGSGLTDILALLPSTVEVLGLGDNNAAKHGTQVAGHAVLAADAFAQLPADLFVISAGAVDPIRAQLEGLGVAADRIVAACPSHSVSLKQAANADIAKLNAELGIGLAPMGLATMYLCPDPDNLGAIVPSGDFVRIQSFRLAAEEVKSRNVPGSIAELGVYQGNQAALLNRLFPGRTLHLFDTFEGFSSADLSTEKNAGFSGAALGDFADTSVDLVLGKMADASVVQVHKGFFPGTAEGVEDTYAFVSLDVDLYEPTLAGLEYFYARLSKGGFIFCHDYNSIRYKGVRSAVQKFVEQSGACMFPIPDFAGSVAILK